ncbi:MAG TPA: CvpA family protein [Candidatus Caccenecus avistercoris]|nr:CvpA family protein [Candidatus Caccenecus avistercoris]
MTIVDAVVILFLLLGAVLGFKKGAIRSLVGLVGTIAVVVIAYYLKNPVADLLYNFVPFFDFSGNWQGLVTLNILLYESIAYVLVFVILYGLLSLILRLTGIIEKFLTMTIILGIPSKIIGAVLGFLEAVVFSFIILFVLLQFNGSHTFIKESTVAMSILDKTPLIGAMVNDTYDAIVEISDLQDKYKDSASKDEYNAEILGIMLRYHVVTPDTTRKLIDNGKLDFAGAEAVLNTFEEE